MESLTSSTFGTDVFSGSGAPLQRSVQFSGGDGLAKVSSGTDATNVQAIAVMTDDMLLNNRSIDRLSLSWM